MKSAVFLLNIVDTLNEMTWLYLWIDSVLEKKNFLRDKKKMKIVGILFVLLETLVIVGMNQIDMVSLYTSITAMCLAFFMIAVFWKSDIMTAVAVLGVYYLLIFAEGNVEISAAGALGGARLVEAVTTGYGWEKAASLLFHNIPVTLLYGTIVYFSRKKQFRLLYQQSKTFVAFMSAAGFAGAAFIGTMLLENYTHSVGKVWYLFMLILLAILAVCYYFSKQQKMRHSLEQLDYQNRILEQNYEQVNDFYSANAKLYHDMHHHLDAIYSMLLSGENAEAQNYLLSLRTDDSYTNMKIKTGINILDAVLNETARKCEARNIDFVPDVPMLPADLAIESRDLCSLFANLLDNAAEAAKSKVMLQIQKKQQMLLIVVKNDYCLSPQKERGRFLTRKADKSRHGWGTQIIEQIVQKYDGTVKYEEADGMISIYAMLNEKE